MNSSKSLNNSFLKYIDYAYFIKLLLLVGLLYWFNTFYLDVINPQKSVYNPFFAEYLNYPAWLVYSILNTAKFITNIFGINSFIENASILKATGGTSVFMAPDCIGLGVMSFWFAFVIAERNSIKRKLFWIFSGIVAIWLINCLRVALILVATQNNWPINFSKFWDHHRIFNACMYGLIILMMYIYSRYNKKPAIDSSSTMVESAKVN
jgi:exosortase/archaeosortase family protein